MNKFFAFSLIIIAICLAYCDLAVTDMENDDAELSDTELLTDIVVSDIVTDILVKDEGTTDITADDIVITGCENDRDCNIETPFCKDKVCVQCRTSDDCESNQICNEKFECEAVEKTCIKNTDCDMGYICKDKKCIEGCVTNKDCPPASKPNNKFCYTASDNPVCVECIADSDCVNAGLGTKCDESKVCITITCDPPCKTWEHCTNEAICELNDGACNSDKDCQLIDPANICNMTTHTCEFKPQCNIDEDCNALCPECGGYCRSQKCDCIVNCPKKGVCEKCNDTIECDEGLECKGITGKYCQPASCQTQEDCGGKYCVMGYCVCGI